MAAKKKGKEVVYITKEGDILRDLPAAVEIVRKDVEEVLEKTGMVEYLSKPTEEKDRLRKEMERESEKSKEKSDGVHAEDNPSCKQRKGNGDVEDSNGKGKLCDTKNETWPKTMDKDDTVS